MEFVKGFFREDSKESMTRLVFFMSVLAAIGLCYGSMLILALTGKDYTSQAALLSSLLLGSSTVAKISQKGKESLPNPKEQ